MISLLQPTPASGPDALQTVSASQFTLEQLTALYNQTRVDYMVPMPMNVARLAEYVQAYDVDLNRSVVAIMDGEVTGLGMLGVRPARTWITRLGVLPVQRKHGTGRAIAEALLAHSAGLGAAVTVLEVIKNNAPAYNLFHRCGFSDVRELVVLRRPPGPPAAPPAGEVRWLEKPGILALLKRRQDLPAWITATESLANTHHILQGLSLRLPGGGEGWLAFQLERHGKFIVNLSHLVQGSEGGEAAEVALAMLAHLYQRYPDLDTLAENIALDDPHLPALQAMGFVETFRRIEMQRPHASPLGD